ncbi:MAG: hypothetical protein QG671_4519 [Actinomycetota bacterium]|jgi:hypothetical protein|nr:hypothetical protein [Actinomycetota bacterium]
MVHGPWLSTKAVLVKGFSVGTGACPHNHGSNTSTGVTDASHHEAVEGHMRMRQTWYRPPVPRLVDTT